MDKKEMKRKLLHSIASTLLILVIIQPLVIGNAYRAGIYYSKTNIKVTGYYALEHLIKDK